MNQVILHMRVENISFRKLSNIFWKMNKVTKRGKNLEKGGLNSKFIATDLAYLGIEARCILTPVTFHMHALFVTSSGHACAKKPGPFGGPAVLIGRLKFPVHVWFTNSDNDDVYIQRYSSQSLVSTIGQAG